MSRKLKILCLHGYRQSDKSFREKTGGLRKSLKAVAEFEFVCAPHAVLGEEDSFSWFFSNPATHHLQTYNCLDDSTEDPGFDTSVKFLLNHIANNGPYDGIMAFSQGACMSSMLAAMKPTETALQCVSFIVFFCGFRSRISKHDKYYAEPIAGVRSLHVYGSTDVVIPLQMCERLREAFSEPRSLEHEGGHYVPSSAAVRNTCKDFLLGEVKLKFGVG